VEISAQIGDELGPILGRIDVAGGPGGPALLGRQLVQGLAAGRECQREQKDRPAHRDLPDLGGVLPGPSPGGNPLPPPLPRGREPAANAPAARHLSLEETHMSASTAPAETSFVDRCAVSCHDLVALVGRLVMSWIFLSSGFTKLTDVAAFSAGLAKRGV